MKEVYSYLLHLVVASFSFYFWTLYRLRSLHMLTTGTCRWVLLPHFIGEASFCSSWWWKQRHTMCRLKCSALRGKAMPHTQAGRHARMHTCMQTHRQLGDLRASICSKAISVGHDGPSLHELTTLCLYAHGLLKSKPCKHRAGRGLWSPAPVCSCTTCNWTTVTCILSL